VVGVEHIFLPSMEDFAGKEKKNGIRWGKA